MDTLKSFSTGVSSLILGNFVGYFAESVSERVVRYRIETGLDNPREDTTLDYTLDALIEITFLTLGVSLVEKAVPSITRELHSLLFFFMGLYMTQRRLKKNLENLADNFLRPLPSSKSKKETFSSLEDQ